jgi:hypothetical protein
VRQRRHLLLARGTARAREIAVRSALGAGRWRIVRQLLTESVVLATAAAAAGVVLAAWSTRALIAWAPAGVPRLSEAHLDFAALGFAVLVALASSVVCGLAPALQLARADVQATLRDGGRGAAGGGLRDRLRAALIVVEVALSLLLLVGAGLLIRSAIALQHVHPGFDVNGVLTARFTLPETNYADPVTEGEALRRINDAASQLAGVTASAVTSYVAMGGGAGTNGLIPEGKPADGTFYIPAVLRLTTPGFFAAMQTPILKGRGFTDDDRAAGQRVMIVSANFAARAFAGQDAVGKRVFCCEGGQNGLGWKVVVGVAGDIRSRGPAVEPRPEFYLPMAQAPNDAWHWFRTFYVVVRTDRDPLSLVGPLRAAVARIDPGSPDLRRPHHGSAAGRHARHGPVQHVAAVAARRRRPRARGDRHLRGDCLLRDAAHAGDRRAHGTRRHRVRRRAAGAGAGAAAGGRRRRHRRRRRARRDAGAGEPARRRQPHRPLDDRRRRRHTLRRGARCERCSGPARGDHGPVAGAAGGMTSDNRHQDLKRIGRLNDRASGCGCSVRLEPGVYRRREHPVEVHLRCRDDEPLTGVDLERRARQHQVVRADHARP